MTMIRFAAGAALALFLASPALADTTVKVDLWDKGGAISDTMDMGFGMKNADAQDKTMGIKVDMDTIPAGKVTFEATNSSKETIHEMIVAPIAGMDATVPYDSNEERVKEEEAGSLGEVSELDPGKSGALTLDLKPGLYLLYCNIAGHFASGMWTTVEVK